MANETMSNGNGKRSPGDADLVDDSTSKRVQAENQHIDLSVESHQRSVFGRCLDIAKFLVGPDAEFFDVPHWHMPSFCSLLSKIKMLWDILGLDIHARAAN
ncbi:hypothetical protein AC578_6540 [Pseudocercospora eumusae]|uniref:Uncharacterized protein n=1 Tax=Pseudocercospora eumusae TaxID=321146 RepID=A0A139HHQ9_9PEZI|nr:hypothetical protein AC578_6540 [Pseudocercospora eumusae]